MDNTLVKTSEQAYAFLLKFYPKNFRQEFGQEMQFVFSESLQDQYSEHREQGIVMLWGKTFLDIGKSLITQYIESQKGNMKNKNATSLLQNNIVRFALATIAILMVPLLFRWPWSSSDFVIMGVLIFGTGVAYEVISKTIGKKYKVAVAIFILLTFLFVWAELAVGIIGTPFAGN